MPWLIAASVAIVAYGLYLALYVSPPDYQQGETVRIMFLHVPFAWGAMAGYTLIALSALGTLVWRHPLADVSAKAAAPIGAAFTFVALATGAIWGKPMWGTWWVWDARLTSFLLLFFLYLGLISLWQTIEEPSRAARSAAILALVGFINIPVIKFSVDWWNTLHQPASVIRIDGATIHSDILIPLLVMALGATLVFITLHIAAMRNEILRRRIRTLIRSQVEGAPVSSLEQAG
jgi:heme exporter protein C